MNFTLDLMFLPSPSHHFGSGVGLTPTAGILDLDPYIKVGKETLRAQQQAKPMLLWLDISHRQRS